MELSLFLAKAIGLYCVIVSLALLLNRKGVNLLFSMYENPAAVLLTGVVDVALGLFLVLSHNIWVMNFTVIITIMGWALLVRGICRMLFPDFATEMVATFKKKQQLMTLLLIVVLVMGAYLAYMGFTA